MKIGIAYTTHNRPIVATNSILQCMETMKGLDYAMEVVDDASTPAFHSSTFRFEENQGIAVAKNKCLSLLYNKGCEHFFLFDDDLSPTSTMWWQYYVNSGLRHACWNYNRNFIGYYIRKQNFYKIYDKPNGCMLYVTREVLDKVGGFDTDFKGYGFDHVNWSDRIFNNGLTPARYIDINDSVNLFQMADCESSVNDNIRASTIPLNYELYQKNYYSKEFKPFQ